MDVSNLWSLQCMMFLLVGAGAVLKRQGILKEEGKDVLTDAVLYFFLPCNIINSFRMEFQLDILKRFAVVLGISLAVQAVSYALSRVLYNHKKPEIRRMMQYGTIVSNSGFLGLPIAEAIYGPEGMMYASVFIIPMRIMMWSAGIACFTESPDFKTVVKKIAVHPCIIAVYIGLGLMLFSGTFSAAYGAVLGCGIPAVPAVAQVAVTALDKAVRSAGGCTTALTMVLIGMMLADVNIGTMVDRNSAQLSFIRLVALPALVLVGCSLCGIDPFLGSVCVLITGMPVGSTSVILAAKYGCDYVFATKAVVLSTLLSMLTIPLWGMVLG